VPEHAAGELAAVLPKAVLDTFDKDSLELVQGDFVGQKLDERFSDALFKASFRGTPGYVWFLLEHQSEPDRFMVLRMLEYLVRGWSELLRREPERQSLPPVVCVVVHHGEQGWNAPTRLRELVDGITRVPELGAFLPDFHIVVDDLVRQPDEALKERSLGPFPKVVLWVLRDARVVQRLYQHLVAWAAELDRLSREAPEDAATVMRYILSVAGDEPLDTLRSRIVEIVPTTEHPMASAAEQLIQRGKALGMAEGKAEGKAEGVLAVLESRGLTVTHEQHERILGCKDTAELDRWLRRAVTIATASDLFSH
jgi:predicted transposase/invertase (TIGR01784 family)